MGTPITKVVNFRLRFETYTAFCEEAKKKNMTLTDCILTKLYDSTKVVKLKKRIQIIESHYETAMRILAKTLASDKSKEDIQKLINELRTLK